MSEEPEITIVPKPQVEPIWGVIANIVDEHPYGSGGKETRKGTPKFNAGQKVYFQDAYWGMAGTESTYIGRYRGKHGYITCTINTGYVTNFRAQLIYSPTIIHRLIYGNVENPSELQLTPEYISASPLPLDGSEESHQKAEYLAAKMNEVAERERQERTERIKRHEANIESKSDNNDS